MTMIGRMMPVRDMPDRPYKNPSPEAFDALLAICEEIANDPKCDLVNSERRLRLYAAIDKAGSPMFRMP